MGVLFLSALDADCIWCMCLCRCVIGDDMIRDALGLLFFLALGLFIGAVLFPGLARLIVQALTGSVGG